MTDKYGTLALLHAASTYVRQWTIVFPVLNLSVCVVAAIQVDTSMGCKIQNTILGLLMIASHTFAQAFAPKFQLCTVPVSRQQFGQSAMIPEMEGNDSCPAHWVHFHYDPDNMLSTHAHIFRSS